MRRYVLYSLGVLGIVSLAGGIWWLLVQASEGGHGPSFFISTSIFLLVFAANLQTETGVEVCILESE